MSHSCGHSDPPWKEILRLGNLRGNIKSQQDVLAATLDTEWTVRIAYSYIIHWVVNSLSRGSIQLI